MSIVVICDRCGKKIDNEDNRVVVSATLYKLFDADDAAATVPSSVAPGTPTPETPARSGPMQIAGSTASFSVGPAFDGQFEMHEQCWTDWFDSPHEEGTDDAE